MALTRAADVKRLRSLDGASSQLMQITGGSSGLIPSVLAPLHLVNQQLLRGSVCGSLSAWSFYEVV